MILKDREYPAILVLLDILIPRLPKTHPKQPLILAEYKRRLAGYCGEKRLDEFLDGIPSFPFFILRDLCLVVKGVRFQMDTLLLSSNYSLIIESKNIAGNLLFDTSYNQLIRTTENKEEAFDDPILQVQNQKRNLTNWFKEKKITPLPINTLVVMSNSSSVIKSTSGNATLSQNVIPLKKILSRIEHLSDIHQEKLYSEKVIKKIAKQLINHHQSLKVDVLKKYNISPTEILSGVQCPNCSVIPMEYLRGKWICSGCITESKDAHHKGVDDYLLLVKNTITNKEFRDFLQIPSMNIASKLLNKMNLQSNGAKKTREYFKKRV